MCRVYAPSLERCVEDSNLHFTLNPFIFFVTVSKTVLSKDIILGWVPLIGSELNPDLGVLGSLVS